MSTDPNGIVGFGTAIVYGPDGEIKQQVEFRNIVTDQGDLVYATRGVGTGANIASGMRLGTGTTATAKSGAGAAIVTYVSASSVGFETGYPALSDKGAGSGYRISYRSAWAAGVATNAALAEVVITNETPRTDVAGAAGDTISRALLSPVVDKGADDTLEITWNHDFLGA